MARPKSSFPPTQDQIDEVLRLVTEQQISVNYACSLVGISYATMYSLRETNEVMRKACDISAKRAIERKRWPA